MATKRNSFLFRHDASFMQALDDWRANQRPIPSRSNAIRSLTLRGASIDNYLAVILEKSLKELISAGVVSDQADSEIYKRFQEVVAKSLDQAALLDQQSRQKQNEHPQDLVSDSPEAQEKQLRDKCEPNRTRYSR